MVLSRRSRIPQTFFSHHLKQVTNQTDTIYGNYYSLMLFQLPTSLKHVSQKFTWMEAWILSIYKKKKVYFRVKKHLNSNLNMAEKPTHYISIYLNVAYRCKLIGASGLHTLAYILHRLIFNIDRLLRHFFVRTSTVITIFLKVEKQIVSPQWECDNVGSSMSLSLFSPFLTGGRSHGHKEWWKL